MIDFGKIDISSLPKYSIPFKEIKNMLEKIIIGEVHVPSDKVAKVWKLKNEFFDYNLFLSEISKSIAIEGTKQIFTGHLAVIAEIVDEYVSKHLFGQEIDFAKEENYCVLNWSEIWNFIKNQIRMKIVELLGEPQYVYIGNWRQLS